MQLAQAGDPRITALEEQIRSLAGTVEELNFQILQMQEQMRKMQEDNEFRFQELEKKTDAGTSQCNDSVAEIPAVEPTEQAKAMPQTPDPCLPSRKSSSRKTIRRERRHRGPGKDLRNDHL